MCVSILEALQNADYNLRTNSGYGITHIARSQLHNALTLLEKSYPLHTLVEPLLEKYDKIENVPNFEESNE